MAQKIFDKDFIFTRIRDSKFFYWSLALVEGFKNFSNVILKKTTQTKQKPKNQLINLMRFYNHSRLTVFFRLKLKQVNKQTAAE